MPSAMVEEKEMSKMKFQVLAKRLIKLRWFTVREADDADLQFDEFVDSECSKQKNLPGFDKTADAVDLFLGDFLHKNQKFISFWRVCGIIIVISYGQSAIKRGFSVNKRLLVQNLQEKFSVSQQIVYVTTSTQTRIKFKSVIFRVISKVWQAVST